MQKIFYESPEEFLTDPRFRRVKTDGFFRFQVSRFLLSGIILSLLLHTIFFFMQLPAQKETETGSVKRTTMEVSLVSPQKPEPAIVTPSVAQPQPKVKVITQKPKPIKPKVAPKPPVFTVPKELEKIDTEPLETKPVEPAPPINYDVPPPVPETSESAEPTDMMSYIKKQRQARIASGDPAAINADAIEKETGPSLEEKRRQRIEENLKSGTNGIFEITSLRARDATFAFKGWTGNFSDAKTQFFVVEASTGQDVRLLMIRRMIALIRTHYDGDFKWQSQRLNQVVTLSARLADSAGLEHFMMTEFFGPNYQLK
jgi:hypothetical protein